MSQEKEKKDGVSTEGKTPRQKPQNAEKKPEQKPQQKKPSQPKKPATGGKKPASGKSKPHYTGKELILRRVYLGLTILSAIIVAVYVFWSFFAAPPDVERPGHGDQVVTRPPITTSYIDDETGELVEMEIPGLPADRKEEFYTFLLVGKSQETGGGLTDTMMLVAYDVPNQALSVMSLPRDTYVRYNGRAPMLNAVYNMAGGDKDGKGIAGLKKAVKDLTGIYPDFHIILQWEAFGELVDAIGGVYFEVPFDMYYNDLSQHFKINLKKGYQLLDGNGAMGVVRWRHNSDDKGHISSTYGYAEGDIGRIKTQQAFMKEVIKKCLQPDVILKSLGSYIDIFQRNVETNLEAGHIAYFVQSAVGGLDMENVKFTTLPNGSAGNGHLLPAGRQIVTAVNDGFNPYKEDIRLGELTLATMDDVPRTSKEPEESEGPDETDDPDESPEPGETSEPGSEDDPLLPPGVTATPRPSRRPTESGGPTESPKASGSPKPSSSSGPGESGSPKPSESQGGEETPPPADTPTPAEPTPPPAPTPVPDDEPLLPPGV